MTRRSCTTSSRRNGTCTNPTCTNCWPRRRTLPTTSRSTSNTRNCSTPRPCGKSRAPSTAWTVYSVGVCLRNGSNDSYWFFSSFIVGRNNKQIFHTPLREHLKATDRKIAYVIELCVCCLLEKGLYEEGLLRVGCGKWVIICLWCRDYMWIRWCKAENKSSSSSTVRARIAFVTAKT